MAKAKPTLALNPFNTKPEESSVQVLMGSPTLGVIRIEWYNAMQGMVCPPNFAITRSTPQGYTVPDAQNILVDTVLRGTFRALLLIEDDTCPPPQALIQFDRWFWKMERKKAPPVVSGLYHIKGSAETRTGKKGGVEMLGPEPLAYRGGGNRAYRDWKAGDVIWVSGVPTGALLVHRSVFDAWAKEPDVDTYTLAGYPFPLRRVFQQPAQVWVDPDTKGIHCASGTSDLWWSDQNIKRDMLAKAGWGDYYKTAAVRKQTNGGEWPYVIDTSLRFGHIDRASGVVY